jgi:hypothetical protein
MALRASPRAAPSSDAKAPKIRSQGAVAGVKLALEILEPRAVVHVAGAQVRLERRMPELSGPLLPSGTKRLRPRSPELLAALP